VPTFLSVTPLIPTGTSIEESVDFYTQQMGFTVLWQGENGAGIRRGDVDFNLVQNNNKEWINNCSVSIGVDDLDALYNEYKDIAAKVGPLEMKGWGRREFHMIVPSGVCFQFYQRG
jgi:catechol 2,3-dioxygenase-like lactoylglutathione lyase family enzyme